MNSPSTDRENLGRAYIVLKKAPQNSVEYEENSWAFEHLYFLVLKNPEEAWHVILLILSLDSSDDISGSIAAGEVEDLLVYHGAQFIDRIEEQSRKNPIFKAMLSGVWKNRIADEIWSRIQNILAERD